ncbi:hypothetical protein AAG906_021820 [Vitis piasezkii]
MNKAKLAIKASVKQWEKYWKVIDRRWENLLTNEEGRKTVHEDDDATNRRVSRRTSNVTQERDVDSCCKDKAPRTISSSSSGVVALVGAIEELVTLVRVLEKMVALGAIMLVK